jgi:hypothetical protein
MKADSVLFFLCRCRYRWNGGYGAGFRLNAFDFSALILLFLSICLFFFLAAFLRLERFRYRLNGGFGTVFRLNLFGFTARSPFLSISISLLCLLFLFLMQ